MQTSVKIDEQVVGKPMILTGAICTIKSGRCSAGTNTQPNSSGEFRVLENTDALRKMVKEGVQTLLKHFPAET